MGFLQNFFSGFNKKELMNKFLIVGIGNIGDKYTNTRHNIGFLVIDEIAEVLKSPLSSVKHGHRAEASYKGKRLFFLNLQTMLIIQGNLYYTGKIKKESQIKIF